MNQHTTKLLANCARTVSFISTARDQEYQARSGLFRRPVNKRACGHFVSSIHRRPLRRGEIKGRKGHLRKKPPFKINVWTCGAGTESGVIPTSILRVCVIFWCRARRRVRVRRTNVIRSYRAFPQGFFFLDRIRDLLPPFPAL